MNTNHVDVLIVDDSDMDIRYVQKALKQQYSLHTCTSAEEALETLEQLRPKVALLDVNMQGMDGFSLCIAMREMPELQDCRIIFLSSLESIEEKMRGFEAGACDFISKPAMPEIIRTKVSVELANHTAMQQLTMEKDNFFNVAMEAVTSAGEVGVVLGFTRDLFQVDSDDALGDLLVANLKELGLSVSIRLKTSQGSIFKSTEAQISELERKLLLHIENSNRIFEFGRQIIFNYPNVSILIRAQIEGEDKRNRYKDIIALLADSTVSYLRRLEKDKVVSNIGADAANAIASVQTQRSGHKKEAEVILMDLMDNLEDSFMSWGLSEEQEQTLLHTVSVGLDKMEKHRIKTEAIEAEFERVLSRMVSI